MRILQKKTYSSPITRRNGFTLTEMMVVIAILGILSAVALPNILAYRENSRLRAAASETLGIFRKAKVYAVKNNYNTFITLNSGTDTISVFSDNGSGGGTANDSTQNGTEPTIYTYILPPNTNIPGTGITFAGNQTGFTSRGLPVGGTLGSVEIHSDSSSTKAIYRVSLSIAGHTRLEVSTDGGGNWQ